MGKVINAGVMGRHCDGDQTEYGQRPAKRHNPQILESRKGTEDHRKDFLNDGKAKTNAENFPYPLSPSVLIPADRGVMVKKKENCIENDLEDSVNEEAGKLPMQAPRHHQRGNGC